MNSTFLAATGFDPEAAKAATDAMRPPRHSSSRAKIVHGPFVCKPGESLLEMAFEHAGMLGPTLADGKRAVKCPWEAHHTSGTTFDTSTVLFPPAEGADIGLFHCSHAHCDGRELKAVLDALPSEAVRVAYERLYAKRQTRRDVLLTRSFVPPSAAAGIPINGAPGPAAKPPVDERYTDVGNARRLVAEFGDDIRYMHPRGCWLAWDSKRWAWDERDLVELHAKQTVAGLFCEIGNISNQTERNALISHAMKSEGAARIRAMVQLARSEPGIAVLPNELDADDWVLNVDNGVLDLRTGTLRPHDRGALLTKLAPVVFDPTAQAPVWNSFVNTVFKNDGDLISYVQRVSGYSLTGCVSAQILVFFYGLGANGKTTYLETLAGVMGDYATQAAPNLLLEKKNDSHPTEIADLMGRRLVMSTEVDQGRKLSEALVKQLTGGDKLKGRFMGKDFFEFRPTHKLFLAANHKPVVHGNDEGIWRRINLVPFNVVIPKAQRDPNLMTKLAAERAGILNWLLRGCLDWQRSGFATSKAVEDATLGYRQEMDRMAGFLRDCCVLGPYAAKAADLYQAYLGWCARNVEAAVQQRTFGLMLGERGFEGTKLHGLAGWKGLRPKTPAELSDER